MRMKSTLTILIGLLLAHLMASTASAVQQRVFFAPSATDPGIVRQADRGHQSVRPATMTR